MAWNHISSSVIPPLDITEAQLAALTASITYGFQLTQNPATGVFSVTLVALPAPPNQMTSAQVKASGALYFSTPIDADAMLICYQGGTLTAAAGTFNIFPLFSSLAATYAGAGNPAAAFTISAAGFSGTQLIPTRPVAPVSVTGGSGLALSRVSMPSLILTSLPTGGAGPLSIEISWM